MNKCTAAQRLGSVEKEEEEEEEERSVIKDLKRYAQLAVA